MDRRRSQGTPVDRSTGPVRLRARASSAEMVPTPSDRWRNSGWPVRSSSYSLVRSITVSQMTVTSSSHPSGRSAAVPPGRMKLWFIRRPVVFSKKASTISRSRNP